MSESGFLPNIGYNDEYDIIVCGGGPAGCTAAVAAAKEGARVLLVESTGALGGMGTSGLVPAWCPVTDSQRVIYGGLAREVFDRAREGVAHVPRDSFDWVAINPEMLKRVYDEMVVDSGVHVLFLSSVCGVRVNGGALEAVLVANKNGLTAYRARVFVDCTGDGDLGAWAGVPFEKGDATTGEMQPATHCFVLSNVDSFALSYLGRVTRDSDNSHMAAILRSSKYPLIKDRHCCNNFLGPSTVGFNAGHLWDVDNTDPQSITNALMLGRQTAEQYRQALAEVYPKAFANSFLTATGSLMGIRETRRIMGDYVLTIEDFLARRSFPDEICRNSYPVDIHTSRNEIEADQRGEVDAMGRFERYKPGESHGIPYRCLTPKGIRNLLVAGRCISTDRPVQASTRVMPVCLAVGQAAGTAAGMAGGRSDSDVHAIDTDSLRKQLKADGAYLP